MQEEQAVDAHVRYRATDGVATVTIDRPDVMNALAGWPGGTRDQIVAAIEEAEVDPSVGCVVLTGAGANFCGGGDLTGNAVRETAAEHRAFLESADAFHARIRGSEVPVIAAVQGYCLGAGVTLVASCDVVIASDDARFGFPEGRLGLVGASTLVSVVGRQWAKFLIMTGELVDAALAQRLGIVLAVEPTEELDARSHDLAARISRMPRQAVRRNRATIDAAADAAGASAERRAALDGDTQTLVAAASAEAPDGRRFRDVIRDEGMSGMKAARAQQYQTPWLR